MSYPGGLPPGGFPGGQRQQHPQHHQQMANQPYFNPQDIWAQPYAPNSSLLGQPYMSPGDLTGSSLASMQSVQHAAHAQQTFAPVLPQGQQHVGRPANQMSFDFNAGIPPTAPQRFQLAFEAMSTPSPLVNQFSPTAHLFAQPQQSQQPAQPQAPLSHMSHVSVQPQQLQTAQAYQPAQGVPRAGQQQRTGSHSPYQQGRPQQLPQQRPQQQQRQPQQHWQQQQQQQQPRPSSQHQQQQQQQQPRPSSQHQQQPPAQPSPRQTVQKVQQPTPPPPKPSPLPTAVPQPKTSRPAPASPASATVPTPSVPPSYVEKVSSVPLPPTVTQVPRPEYQAPTPPVQAPLPVSKPVAPPPAEPQPATVSLADLMLSRPPPPLSTISPQALTKPITAPATKPITSPATKPITSPATKPASGPDNKPATGTESAAKEAPRKETAVPLPPTAVPPRPTGQNTTPTATAKKPEKPAAVRRQSSGVPGTKVTPPKKSSDAVKATHASLDPLTAAGAAPGTRPTTTRPIVETPVPVPVPGSMPSTTGPPAKRAAVSRTSETGASASMPRAVSTSLPVVPQGPPPKPVDSIAVLACVADDALDKAHALVPVVVDRMEQGVRDEYYQLTAFGLTCLEALFEMPKVPPEVEARARLRYAMVVCEETENLMEAEMCLSKGIDLCEKHRFYDLKYYMQFVLLRVIHQRNWKAAIKTADKYIDECVSKKYIQWIYVYRLLKADFYLRSAPPGDPHAIENLRRIAMIASSRDDNGMTVLASLLEGLMYLNSNDIKGETIEKIQGCIAQASKFQFDASANVPKLELVKLLLDTACSLHGKSKKLILQKVGVLQTRLDEMSASGVWNVDEEEVLIPVKKMAHTTVPVSKDTAGILRPGPPTHDYVVVSFLGRLETYILVYLLTGLANATNASMVDNVLRFWQEALVSFQDQQIGATKIESLQEGLAHENWRETIVCYLHILIGLRSAMTTNWPKVMQCIDGLEKNLWPQNSTLVLLTKYLSGVYEQGTGNIDRALEIFSDAAFDISSLATSEASRPPQVELHFRILATLNRIWIMQSPRHRDDAVTTTLLDHLRALLDGGSGDGSDDRQQATTMEEQGVYNAYKLVLATVDGTLSSGFGSGKAGIASESTTPVPRVPMAQVKKHLSTVLSTGRETGNAFFLSLALSILRLRLFDQVVGDQALKSSRAAVQQAKKVGNRLWMGIAHALYAASLETESRYDEAAEERATAITTTRAGLSVDGARGVDGGWGDFGSATGAAWNLGRPPTAGGQG